MACFPFCCVVGCVGYAACLVSGIVRFVCVVLVGDAGYSGLFVGNTVRCDCYVLILCLFVGIDYCLWAGVGWCYWWVDCLFCGWLLYRWWFRVVFGVV